MAKRQVVKVVDFLANELRKNGLTISKIILFGSQAKGRASAESDIDVDSHEKGIIRFKFIR